MFLRGFVLTTACTIFFTGALVTFLMASLFRKVTRAPVKKIVHDLLHRGPGHLPEERGHQEGDQGPCEEDRARRGEDESSQEHPLDAPAEPLCSCAEEEC